MSNTIDTEYKSPDWYIHCPVCGNALYTCGDLLQYRTVESGVVCSGCGLPFVAKVSVRRVEVSAARNAVTEAAQQYAGKLRAFAHRAAPPEGDAP